MVRPGRWQVSAVRSEEALGVDTNIMNISMATARVAVLSSPSAIVQGWCLAFRVLHALGYALQLLCGTGFQEG